MTIEAIMVDVDGVLLVHPEPGGWSTHLERDLGVSTVKLQNALFDRHWDDIIHGRARLRERLEPVLADIAPHVSYAALIHYWFSNDAHVNRDLCGELASLRGSGVQIHLATVQEHERAHYIWTELGFQDAFDGLHYAAALGCAKPSADFYRAIETRTGFEPKALFFIDDKIANVEAAISCGWAAALWTGKDKLRSLLPQ